jgi:hypothetical protein
VISSTLVGRRSGGKAQASASASAFEASVPRRNGRAVIQRAGSLRSRARTPARIKDDLPLPDAPVINSSLGAPVAWRRRRRSASTTCQLSSERPKKIAASSTSNAARPG